jgi:Holliday junction resolvase
MNTAGKGARNERRSMALLEAAGYQCTRAAASLGAWDIIGIGSKRGTGRAPWRWSN